MSLQEIANLLAQSLNAADANIASAREAVETAIEDRAKIVDRAIDTFLEAYKLMPKDVRNRIRDRINKFPEG